MCISYMLYYVYYVFWCIYIIYIHSLSPPLPLPCYMDSCIVTAIDCWAVPAGTCLCTVVTASMATISRVRTPQIVGF